MKVKDIELLVKDRAMPVTEWDIDGISYTELTKEQRNLKVATLCFVGRNLVILVTPDYKA